MSSLSDLARRIGQDVSETIRHRGLLANGDHYQTLEEGIYYCASGSVASNAGLPKDAQGWVIVLGSPQAQRSVTFRTVEISSSLGFEVWELTSNHNGAWTNVWKRTHPAPGPYESGARLVEGLWPGEFVVERAGRTVSVDCRNGRPTSTGQSAAVELPPGFRPARRAVGVGSDSQVARPVVAQPYGPYSVDMYGVAAVDSWVDFSIRFTTDDPIPTTLPGTPV